MTTWCEGQIAAGITAYDPVYIRLTETFSSLAWTRTNIGLTSGNLNGQCYANTGLSTWLMDSCSGVQTVDEYLTYLDSVTWGDYHNDDFLFDDQRTWVFQQAGVSFSNGIRSWNNCHYDDGEANFLIFGSTFVPVNYSTAIPTVDPLAALHTEDCRGSSRATGSLYLNGRTSQTIDLVPH